MRFKNSMSKKNGFTLIELIIGIVVFAISLSIILQLILPTERNSADQIHQIKAAQLGQALLDDIMSRSFDENSNRAGGILRCNEDWDRSGAIDANEQCSSINATTGVVNQTELDENTRIDFDDVDDFHGYNNSVDSLTQNLAQGYNDFTINVQVLGNRGGDIGLANSLAKRITVTITTPLNTEIAFTAYKTNF